MALPREPRQKMINMMYLVLTALLALNVSAEILNAFKTVNNSLESSVSTVNKSTETVMNSLLEKTTQAESAVKAGIWYPKAQQVQALTKSLNDYIAELKGQILKGADFDPQTGKYKEDNLDIATRIMVEKGGGKTLFQRLTQYKKDVLAVDSAIGKEFANSLPLDLSMPPTQHKSNSTSWESAYFRMVPTVAALTILSKFQNDVKTTENKLVSYCHEQVGKVQVRFDTYTAIVGQSSNYIMPGQDIEVMAGVGAFSKAAAPKITINGANANLGEDGAAHMKIPGGTLGDHTIPIRISYVDQEGNPQTIDKTITYTVGQANASIALDKMNVLYIGVDNPITIAASGGGDDKIKPTIEGAGGTISRVGNGKYIVRVSQQSDDCLITVNVDGKPAGASRFRVRRIPTPVATIGGFASGENIPAGTFRAQGGVAAWIKDFPFELKYKVTRFIISTDSDDGDIVEAQVNGNAFDEKAQSLIRTHVKAGKTVYIDDIRAQGEDGETRKLPTLVYYIK